MYSPVDPGRQPCFADTLVDKEYNENEREELKSELPVVGFASRKVLENVPVI